MKPSPFQVLLHCKTGAQARDRRCLESRLSQLPQGLLPPQPGLAGTSRGLPRRGVGHATKSCPGSRGAAVPQLLQRDEQRRPRAQVRLRRGSEEDQHETLQHSAPRRVRQPGPGHRGRLPHHPPHLVRLLPRQPKGDAGHGHARSLCRHLRQRQHSAGRPTEAVLQAHPHVLQLDGHRSRPGAVPGKSVLICIIVIAQMSMRVQTFYYCSMPTNWRTWLANI